jgi:hypothetical protein
VNVARMNKKNTFVLRKNISLVLLLFIVSSDNLLLATKYAYHATYLLHDIHFIRIWVHV